VDGSHLLALSNPKGCAFLAAASEQILLVSCSKEKCPGEIPGGFGLRGVCSIARNR
jgi:hypothetical protein